MAKDGDFHQEHREGFAELNTFWEDLEAVETDIKQRIETSQDYLGEQLERIANRLHSFEPTVSIIGQIKAGKSTLLNAMVGQTDLLPSDVNPWTSVITGLHLNSRNRPDNTRALFRFFDAEEWDRLVETGGRLGEMAARAGFDSEVEEVREQVEQMRQTTEQRLGDEFHQLLGQSRAFPTIEKDTLDRYICYGDPEDIEDGATEGVYADLTKLADLYIDLPGYPRGLCFRDTPGVNDTFMMREQITLNAISESRMCVVVLSAHQALNTMDLALLRIICSVESREVLIFVNRIDELAAPATDIKKIERDIRFTLSRMGMVNPMTILFGSGYWANCALDDSCETMMASSRASLAALYPDADLSDPAILRSTALEASGVSALHREVARQIVNGPGKTLMDDVAAELAQVSEMDDMVNALATNGSGPARTVDAAAITDQMLAVRASVLKGFDEKTAEERVDLQNRLERARDQFIETAVEALQSHIDAFGETDNWSHEPSGLRMMMRSACTASAAKLRRWGETALQDVADGVHEILQYELNVYDDSAATEFPNQPQHNAPTALAKTLSLDLQGSWWRKFWKVGGKNRAKTRYSGLIEAEVSPIIEELLNDFFDGAADSTRAIVANYIGDQTRFIDAIVDAAVTNGSSEDDPESKKRSAA